MLPLAFTVKSSDTGLTRKTPSAMRLLSCCNTELTSELPVMLKVHCCIVFIAVFIPDVVGLCVATSQGSRSTRSELKARTKGCSDLYHVVQGLAAQSAVPAWCSWQMSVWGCRLLVTFELTTTLLHFVAVRLCHAGPLWSKHVLVS